MPQGDKSKYTNKQKRKAAHGRPSIRNQGVVRKAEAAEAKKKVIVPLEREEKRAAENRF